MADYFRPHVLDEALALKATRDLTVLAGGTDVFPSRATRAAWGDVADPDILDISAIASLRGIEKQEEGYRIGALATWSDIDDSDLPPAFDVLRQVSRVIGGRQIQNRGTVVGNICNASPAADGTPALQALNASVELTSTEGVRVLPLDDFHDGYRSTCSAPGELVTAILIPELPGNARSLFLKLGARRYLVISIAMIAGVLVPGENGTVADIRLSLGACSAVARRLRRLEDDLRGRTIDAELSAVVAGEHLEGIEPIGDMRASADYRLNAALVLVRDLVAGLAGGNAGEV